MFKEPLDEVSTDISQKGIENSEKVADISHKIEKTFPNKLISTIPTKGIITAGIAAIVVLSLFLISTYPHGSPESIIHNHFQIS